jgi:CAAX prenyl protease-like protein
MQVELVGEFPAQLDVGKATTSYLLPLVTFSALALSTGLLFEPLDRLYGLRVTIATVVLVSLDFRFKLLGTSLTWPAFAAGLLALGLWLLLLPEPEPRQVQEFSEQLAGLARWERLFWFVSRVMGAVVLVPIVEELAFRGYLTRRLTNPDFVRVPHQSVPLWALGVSTALFAVLHGAVLAAFAAGAVYALLVRMRGRLGEAMVAHAVTNLGLCVLAFTSGNLAYWM